MFLPTTYTKLLMKQLKYNSPIITSSPTIATLFSIISGEEYSENWICNNFNNLLYIKNPSENRCIFFEDQPNNRETIFSEINFFEYNKISVAAFQSLSFDIQKFIEKMIDNHYYIRIALDNYYISLNTRLFKQQHFLHPVTIYGYDISRKTFLIGDFFDRKKYQLYNLPYKELEEAFYFCTYSNDEVYEYLKNIIFIKVFPNYPKEEINLNKIISETNDYILSTDNTLKYENRIRKKSSDFFYGIDCYNNLMQSIEDRKVDIRSTHVIYDRLQLQSYKLDILFKNSYITPAKYYNLKEQINSLITFSLDCRNATLKFQIKQTNPQLIIEKYNDLKFKEQEYLFNLLSILK